MATTTGSTGSVTVTFAERAVWSTSYIDNLPDSSFLHIEGGGSKDSENKTTPRSLRHFPYRDSDGNVDMAHLRNALSRIPQSNLPAGVKAEATAKAERILKNQGSEQLGPRDNPPKENLVRAMGPEGLELRDNEDSPMPTLVTRFSPFGQWTKIDSAWEGTFLERFSPQAFDKTIAENRGNMRVLFQHGKDPQIGNKVLGPIADIYTRDDGAWADVPLFDTSYNRDLLPGLRAGVYGSSHRFKVMREDFVKRPGESEHNPEGLPERTVVEARLMEFGPVTFPAYEGATAGVRSMTDDYILSALLENPDKLAELIARRTGQPAPSTQTPAEATSAPERRVPTYTHNSREDFTEWLSSLNSTL